LNKPSEGLLLNLSSVSLEDEPVTLKQENVFDLLESESEKIESKDFFGGFVDTTNTNNEDIFNPFVSKTNSNVSNKIVLNIACNNYNLFLFFN